MLPPSPLTVPDVRISRIRFFAEELRSGGVPVTDLRGGGWMGCEEDTEGAPEERLRACSPFQPFPPDPCDLLGIPLQLPHVPRDCVVGIVTSQLRGQHGVLIEDRPVAAGPGTVVDRDQRAGEPAFGRRLPHHVFALL